MLSPPSRYSFSFFLPEETLLIYFSLGCKACKLVPLLLFRALVQAFKMLKLNEGLN